MSDGGKGDKRRPEAEPGAYTAGWDRIFNRGMPEQPNGTGSNPVSGREPTVVGANPTPAAIYVDDATGSEVSESWWPGDPVRGDS